MQNAQNRDPRAMHLKVDELLRAVHGAREGEFIDLEHKGPASRFAACDAGPSSAPTLGSSL